MSVEQPRDEQGAASSDPPAPNLGERAVRGATVTMLAQASKIVIQMLSVMILARLLTPGDYGLIAMVMAIANVADIFRDFGLSTAAIQAPTLHRHEQHNLFWLNTALGAVLAGLVFLGAPLLAWLYQEPELIPIARTLAVIFLINGMITQYRADLVRRLLFKRLAVADILGPLAGLGVAVSLAMNRFEYWALVGQQITQLSVVLIVVLIAARWLPGGYHRGTPMKPFLRFGGHLVGSQLVNYVGNNIDTFMLGIRVGASPLGLYSRAYQLLMMPLQQVRGPLTTVAIPILARVQNDEKRFHDYVAKGQMALGYSLVAGMGFVAGMATPIVLVFLGDGWLGAVDVLRWLAMSAAFNTLSFVAYWVYVAKGLVRELFHYSFIETGLRVLLVVLGSSYGLVGVAAAMGISPMICWPIAFWWLSRRASIPVRRLWQGGLKIVIFTVVIGAVSWLVEQVSGDLGAVFRLVIGLLAAGLAYVALAWLVPAYRRDIVGILGIVRRQLRTRRVRS